MEVNFGPLVRAWALPIGGYGGWLIQPCTYVA